MASAMAFRPIDSRFSIRDREGRRGGYSFSWRGKFYISTSLDASTSTSSVQAPFFFFIQGTRNWGQLFLLPLTLHIFLATTLFFLHRPNVFPIDRRPAVRAKNASFGNGIAAFALQ